MRKDPVHSEERRQQHLRKTILNATIRRRAGLFWALFCGLTFFSDLLQQAVSRTGSPSGTQNQDWQVGLAQKFAEFQFIGHF
jgi:hypothetical protein